MSALLPPSQEESRWPEDADADDWEPADEMDEDAAAQSDSADAPEEQQQQQPTEDPARADAGYIQVFLLKYVCPRGNCFGTMAPTAAGSSLHECNMCGFRRSEEAFMADLDSAMQ